MSGERTDERAARIGKLLVRGDRKYRLVALAADGSGLYERRERLGSDFWLRTPDRRERSWSYATRFGRKRPLPPPAGGGWHGWSGPRRMR